LDLWSGIEVALVVGLIQVLVVGGLVYTGLFKVLLDNAAHLGNDLIEQAGAVLFINCIAWLLSGSIGGIFTRVLTAFDYYPRLSWWGVLIISVKAIAPAVAVVMGASLLTVGITLAVATIIVNSLLFTDIFHLLQKEDLFFKKTSFRIGWRNFLKSLGVSGRNLLENLRVGGVRIILAPLTGSVGLVTFSTIRTGANFAMQGLHTITNPLMPELMKFLRHRDQERSETAFGTIWVIVIAIMAPAVVLLQAFIQPLFSIWTNGKVVFDPFLFAILSLSVLVYAIAQPAISIVTGNNLLKTQLLLSAIAAIIVIGGMFTLVPIMGIRGAGAALLAAEIVVAKAYKISASAWLKDHELVWPRQSSSIANTSVWISAASMGALIIFPAGKFIVLAAALLLMYLNLTRYWLSLPNFTRKRTKDMVSSWPLLGKIWA